MILIAKRILKFLLEKERKISTPSNSALHERQYDEKNGYRKSY
jgi:hypothetical protein